MVSNSHYSETPLLDKGYYYMIKQEIAHLKAGMKVRVMNAQYHRAPNSDDGGFIIEFPDMAPVRLDHIFDQQTIKSIELYFEKREAFDWPQALQELKKNYGEVLSESHEEMKKETFLQNKKTKGLLQTLMAKGMTAKEAYKHIRNNNLDFQ
jgi:hypothetical protein